MTPTYTNPHTNTSSDVEVTCDAIKTLTSYTIGEDLTEIAEVLRRNVFFVPGMQPCLTFFLWKNTKAEDVKFQFDTLINLFKITPEEIHIQYDMKRVYAEKVYGVLRICIHADIQNVLDKRTISTTVNEYYYNDAKIGKEKA